MATKTNPAFPSWRAPGFSFSDLDTKADFPTKPPLNNEDGVVY